MINNFVVTAECIDELNLAPKDVYHEIYQNVRCILSTPKGSVPLDRNFGISAQIVDAPIARAKAILSSEIVEAIETYEPRAAVEEITFQADMDGKLMPKVRISINEELI